MIKVTRFNSEQLIVNVQLIEMIESTPDTVITLTTGKKIVVKESTEEIITQSIGFYRKILGDISDRIRNRGD